MQRNEYVLKNMFGSFFLAAGASYATALSDLIAFISLLPYMRENSRIFRSAGAGLVVLGRPL